MKTIISILLLGVSTLSVSAQTKWNLNSEDTKIEFEYKTEKTEGSFSGLTTEIIFDVDDLSNSKIKATVPVNKLNTKSKMRDKHLMTPEFFDAAKYPNITFTSKSFEKTDKGYKVTGTLKMKDVSNDEVINFTFENNTFVGDFSIDAAKYGVIEKPKKEEIVTIHLVVPVTK